MTSSVEMRSGLPVVRVVGEMRDDDDGALELKAGELLDGPPGRVVLDLSGVNYISSAGISTLVKLTAKANQQGGRLVMAGPTPFVAGVFETTRLTRFFEIVPTVDDAIKSAGRS